MYYLYIIAREKNIPDEALKTQLAKEKRCSQFCEHLSLSRFYIDKTVV